MILQLNELVNKGKNSLSDHEFQFCIQKKFCHHTPCVNFNLAPKQWLRAAGCLARPECSRVLRGPPGEGQHAETWHTRLYLILTTTLCSTYWHLPSLLFYLFILNSFQIYQKSKKLLGIHIYPHPDSLNVNLFHICFIILSLSVNRYYITTKYLVFPLK